MLVSKSRPRLSAPAQKLSSPSPTPTRNVLPTETHRKCTESPDPCRASVESPGSVPTSACTPNAPAFPSKKFQQSPILLLNPNWKSERCYPRKHFYSPRAEFYSEALALARVIGGGRAGGRFGRYCAALLSFFASSFSAVQKSSRSVSSGSPPSVAS